MLAVILVLVVGTIRLIGSNTNNVFSQARFAGPERADVTGHDASQVPGAPLFLASKPASRGD